jgi:hypothetical protein
LPLLSVICVADGMVVPSGEAVPGTAASKTDATVALLFGDNCEELFPPHAAIARHKMAGAALKTLIVRRIETSP